MTIILSMDCDLDYLWTVSPPPVTARVTVSK